MLGVAFVAAALLLSASLNQTVRNNAAAAVGDAAVVVSRASAADAPLIAKETAAAVRRLPGVTGTRNQIDTVVLQDLGTRQAPTALHSLPPTPAPLESGQWPAAAGEVLVSPDFLTARRVQLGQSIVVRGTGDSGPVTFTVVGVLVPRERIGMPLLVASPADGFAARGAAGYDAVYVEGTGSPEELVGAIKRLPAVADAKHLVRTGEAEITARVQAYAQDTQVLLSVLLAFAAVALFVSGLVITNTFAILVAQRTRRLGLLRCVGATRAQVFQGVLIEAAWLGLVGSALGAALGVGLTATTMSFVQRIGLPLADLATPWWALALPLLLGIALTLIAAVRPAWRATRVRPLAALRPEPPAKARSNGRLGLIVGAGCLLVGTGLLVTGAVLPSLVPGLAGGLVSFVGILLWAPRVVPTMAARLGALFGRLGGTPARLAIDNIRMNPGRAATTAGALLVGVTLITMLTVAAATGERSVSTAIDRQYITDAQMTGPAAASPAVLAAIRHTPGVAAAAVIQFPTGPVALRAAEVSREVYPSGMGPDARFALHDSSALAGLTDSTIVVPRGLGVPTNGLVTLTFGDRTVQLRAVVPDQALDAPVITAATLARLGPSVPSVLVRFAPGADAGLTMERLADALAAHGLEVDGPAVARRDLQKTMDTVLAVAIGLLAVAVVIALVGVSNVLGLAVLERRRESGLLRALGLTRGQLRNLFGWEAVTLAAVAVVLGLGLGIGYGIAGAYAMLAGDLDVAPTIPWARLAVIAGCALIAGWLASVLPAGRAARIRPATALTMD